MKIIYQTAFNAMLIKKETLNHIDGCEKIGDFKIVKNKVTKTSIKYVHVNYRTRTFQKKYISQF